MKGVTEKQRRVLAFVVDFTTQYGYPPTLQDIAEGTGFQRESVQVVYKAALLRKGLIEVLASSARGLRVTEAGRAACGRTAEGLLAGVDYYRRVEWQEGEKRRRGWRRCGGTGRRAEAA